MYKPGTCINCKGPMPLNYHKSSRYCSVDCKKEGTKKVSREYYKRNKSLLLAKGKQWRANNPERVSEYLTKRKIIPYCRLCKGNINRGYYCSECEPKKDTFIKEKIRERSKKYRETKREELKRKRNSPESKKYMKIYYSEYVKNKLKNNPNYFKESYQKRRKDKVCKSCNTTIAYVFGANGKYCSVCQRERRLRLKRLSNKKLRTNKEFREKQKKHLATYKINNSGKYQEGIVLKNMFGTCKVPNEIKVACAYVKIIKRLLGEKGNNQINNDTALRMFNKVERGETHVAYERGI